MGDQTQVNEDWIPRACPNCRSTRLNGKRNYRSSSPAEKYSFHQIKRQFIGLNNGTHFFTYIRCGNCNQMYNPLYFSESQLAECYVEMPDNLMGAERKTASINQRGYAKMILPHLKKPTQNYLEIGPDVGLLASALDFSAKFKSVYLIEPNYAVHAQLRNSLESESLREIVPTLSESSASEVDLCVGVHVLDHMLNPREDLLFLRKMLSPGATVAFVIHNEKSILRRILGSKWPPFCLQHPQLFNRSSVSKLLVGAGFEVLKIRRTRNFVKTDNILNNLSQVLGWNLRVTPSKHWPTLRLYFGNIMIVCKKVN